MALENCKECGKEISTKATTCPHCGVKIYRWGWGKKLIAGFVVLWGIAFLVALVNQSPTDRDATQATLEAAKARGLCERALEAQLKAPSTAKFSGAFDTRAGKSEAGDWIVAGHVDSQNSFGAMIRGHYTCRVQPGKEWRVVRAAFLE